MVHLVPPLLSLPSLVTHSLRPLLPIYLRQPWRQAPGLQAFLSKCPEQKAKTHSLSSSRMRERLSTRIGCCLRVLVVGIHDGVDWKHVCGRPQYSRDGEHETKIWVLRCHLIQYASTSTTYIWIEGTCRSSIASICVEREVNLQLNERSRMTSTTDQNESESHIR